jgi:hypothetical protein
MVKQQVYVNVRSFIIVTFVVRRVCPDSSFTLLLTYQLQQVPLPDNDAGFSKTGDPAFYFSGRRLIIIHCK